MAQLARGTGLPKPRQTFSPQIPFFALDQAFAGLHRRSFDQTCKPASDGDWCRAFAMPPAVAVLRDYGVEIQANGQKPWPDVVKAQIVAKTLKSDMTARAVTARYGLPTDRVSQWRIRALDGRFVLPAMSATADGAAQPRKTHTTLPKAHARPLCWQRMLDSSAFASIAELAARQGIVASCVTRVPRMTHRSPDII
jgi:transposase